MFTEGYIIDSTICLAVFWLLYLSLLAERVPDRAARLYLLFAAPVSLLIPALELPLLPPSLPSHWNTGIFFLSDTTLYEEAASRTNYLQTAYIAGAALMLLRMFAGIVKITLQIGRAKVERIGGMKVIHTSRPVPAYSFFNYLFVSEEYASDEALEGIIAHERHHCRLWHSADLIYACLLRSLLWFNPVAWHIVSMLRRVHEYEADRRVIEDGYSINRYINLIVRSEAGISPEFASPLSYSLTKKRLKMMTKNRRAGGLRRLLLTIPVTALLICAFSLTVRAENPSEAPAPPEPLTVAESGTLPAAADAVQQQSQNTTRSSYRIIAPAPSDYDRLAVEIAQRIEEHGNNPRGEKYKSATIFLALYLEHENGTIRMIPSFDTMEEAEAALKEIKATKTASYPLDANRTILFVVE